jgi:UDP-N-acetylmuramoylalanine--D-glutamate ligase
MMYKQAIVLGLGVSGLGAARLLASEGCAVTVWEQKPESALDASCVEAAYACGARMYAGRARMPDDAFDVAVVSPGCALTSPMVQAVADRGCPLLSECELGWSHFRGRVIAVTGSNGKSTVVKWLADSLRDGGVAALPAGNYGPSVCDVVREHASLDVIVLEVSSFQLETVRAFRPDIGILLNIFPNHLDRHGDMDTYVSMKARLFARTTADDLCLTPWSWRDEMKRHAPHAQGRWLTFGNEPEADYVYARGCVTHHGEPRADITGTMFARDAYGPAVAAVVAALHEGGWGHVPVEETARKFKPLPHRVQQVATVRGVAYVNDSKSTNLAAIKHALQQVDGPVHLIAGGLPKENDYKSLKEVLVERVKTVYLIGRSSEAMYAAWSNAVPCRQCGTVEVAVGLAREHAVLGETVLFSPGCASFDQFANYEKRGEQFTRLACQPREEKTE